MNDIYNMTFFQYQEYVAAAVRYSKLQLSKNMLAARLAMADEKTYSEISDKVLNETGC